MRAQGYVSSTWGLSTGKVPCGAVTAMHCEPGMHGHLGRMSIQSGRELLYYRFRIHTPGVAGESDLVGCMPVLQADAPHRFSPPGMLPKPSPVPSKQGRQTLSATCTQPRLVRASPVHPCMPCVGLSHHHWSLHLQGHLHAILSHHRWSLLTTLTRQLGRMDESHLTGESGSVAKDADSAPQALSGSKVLEGCGKLLVTAVGTESQQGIILASLTEGGSEDGAGLKCALIQQDRKPGPKLENLASEAMH